MIPSLQTMREFDFRYDVEYCFHNINSLIDIRRSKKWVKYVLSDNIERYGTMESHFIYNKLPGWLFDAARLCYPSEKDNDNNNNTLSLVYSTDMRGVQLWMGQLCSLINLHNLIAATIEKKRDDDDNNNNNINYTVILMHLAGLLSKSPLNPINRQGMTFPGSILQTTMFENVKKQMTSHLQGDDNLTNSISCALTCTHPPTGTKIFNMLSSNHK